MPENLQAILLAGGKSIRFNTEKTKLTEKICGKEMILYPINLLQRMNIPTTMVVGFQKEKIIEVLATHNIKTLQSQHNMNSLELGMQLRLHNHSGIKIIF